MRSKRAVFLNEEVVEFEETFPSWEFSILGIRRGRNQNFPRSRIFSVITPSAASSRKRKEQDEEKARESRREQEEEGDDLISTTRRWTDQGVMK